MASYKHTRVTTKQKLQLQTNRTVTDSHTRHWTQSV